MIEVRHVSLSYGKSPALRDVSLEVRPGELVTIMGPMAAGKSTLAKVMGGLYLPDEGECRVDGVSTRDAPACGRVGLVFQEPEDQIVARRVRDDLAFGPSNLGAEDVVRRVDEAIRLTGIEGLAGRDVRGLSGGQRQLVAIAGVLAMRPAYLVMDEPTSQLDSEGIRMVTRAVGALKKDGKGIVVITQDPAIAASADRLLVMSAGSIVSQGPPGEVFSCRRPDEGNAAGLVERPEVTRLWERLREKGVVTGRPWLTVQDALEELCR